MMAIAEHHPEQLYARNKAAAQMSKEQLHEFAATKEKGLPAKKKKNNPHKKHWRTKAIAKVKGWWKKRGKK